MPPFRDRRQVSAVQDSRVDQSVRLIRELQRLDKQNLTVAPQGDFFNDKALVLAAECGRTDKLVPRRMARPTHDAVPGASQGDAWTFSGRERVSVRWGGGGVLSP